MQGSDCVSEESNRPGASDGGAGVAIALVLILLLGSLGAAGFWLLAASGPTATAVAPPAAAAFPPPAQSDAAKETPAKKKEEDSHGDGKPSLDVLHWDGLHNVVHFAEDLYSGNSPETPEAFATLARHGIKTIVSVDGAAPKVELAKAVGIGYVHIPVAYATITPEQQALLARVVKERPKPIYLHCHHGKHRGPAAAAILWRCNEASCTAAKSLELLKAAGTDPKYQGLYAVVEAYTPPASDAADSAHEKLPPLPESVPPPALVDAMLELDGVWDRWKARQAAGWPQPTESDAKIREAAADATLLREQYEEMRRLPAAKGRDVEFVKQLETGLSISKILEDVLQSKDDLAPDVREGLGMAVAKIGKTCSTCHAKFRDVVAK